MSNLRSAATELEGLLNQHALVGPVASAWSPVAGGLEKVRMAFGM